jgi:ATPase subunit of ABC transporter with duplicated ATPase domains
MRNSSHYLRSLFLLRTVITLETPLFLKPDRRTMPFANKKDQQEYSRNYYQEGKARKAKEAEEKAKEAEEKAKAEALEEKCRKGREYQRMRRAKIQKEAADEKEKVSSLRNTYGSSYISFSFDVTNLAALIVSVTLHSLNTEHNGGFAAGPQGSFVQLGARPL